MRGPGAQGIEFATKKAMHPPVGQDLDETIGGRRHGTEVWQHTDSRAFEYGLTQDLAVICPKISAYRYHDGLRLLAPSFAHERPFFIGAIAEIGDTGMIAQVARMPRLAMGLQVLRAGDQHRA